MLRNHGFGLRLDGSVGLKPALKNWNTRQSYKYITADALLMYYQNYDWFTFYTGFGYGASIADPKMSYDSHKSGKTLFGFDFVNTIDLVVGVEAKWGLFALGLEADLRYAIETKSFHFAPRLALGVKF